MILSWQMSTNIENSLIEFLRNKITEQSLQLLDSNGVAKTVNVYAGRDIGDWNLPLIQLYYDNSPDLNRLEIGSNKRLKSWQIIIDVRTFLPGQETNVADWIFDEINDGFTVYDYTPNSLNPENPAKTKIGHGRVDFISSLPTPSYEDADVYDQNRYRLTIKVWINS